MKFIGILLFTLLISAQSGSDLYLCKNAKITIYSSALIEDIKADSNVGLSVFNPVSGELNFSVLISSFQFQKAFMQQHFNSDYMESDKYPRAIFKGKVQEHIDVTRDGSYPVTATGSFTVHGITKPRTILGNITVKNGIVSMSAEFIVNCADHHIDIPQILFYHIAENIKVTVSATDILYKNSSNQ